MRRIPLVLGLGAILIGATAWGITPNPQCVLDAKSAKQLCTQTCQDNFRMAKDDCRNVDHDCADTCRGVRDTCLAPIYAVLQSCLDVCNTTLDSAKTDCRALYAKGSDDRNHCIDAAQITAFMCRDTCRENLDRAALRECRKAFHQCMVACPPAAN